MAVIAREGVGALSGDEWSTAGIYLLIDRHQRDGRWGLYVGRADRIGKRLKEQLREMDSWYRAVVLLRYGSPESQFDTVTSLWLERRLYDVFSRKDVTMMHNSNRPPGNRSVSHFGRQVLEERVTAVSRVLRLIGHESGPVDTLANVPTKTRDEPSAGSAVRSEKVTTATKATKESPKRSSGRKSRYYGVKTADLVSAGLLSEGNELESTNKKWHARARVGPGGTIVYNDVPYDNPSAAAKAVKGGAAVNGWRFWAVRSASNPEPLITLYQLRERFETLNNEVS